MIFAQYLTIVFICIYRNNKFQHYYFYIHTYELLFNRRDYCV
ncbi:hypothetical protein CNEO4_410081 [Clostridium neonatale]|nr:hypothetical protein CNEO4_410081 [Clostridium neonatale]